MPSGISIPRKYNTLPASETPKSYVPVEQPRRPHHLSKPTSDRPLVFLADGMTLSQTPGLRPLPGQVGLATGSSSTGIRDLPAFSEPPNATEPIDNYLCSFDANQGFDDIPMEEVSRHQRRRKNQTRRWLEDVIPCLISPYISLIHKTKSFHFEPARVIDNFSCVCTSSLSRSLDIKVIRFYVIETIELNVCKCHPAAVQLTNLGLFPSAPLAPSLAVDIRVLEFVSKLFLNIAPNTTAWCKTVEGFLETPHITVTLSRSIWLRNNV